MHILFLIVLFCFGFVGLSAQSLYFPPNNGTWQTIDPQVELKWCPEKMDSLEAFLGEKDTKAFIILKDGRIAVEWYYGNFTADSLWYWASAGKSLTGTLIGIAQQEGLLDIQEPTTTYLGKAWTACTEAEEAPITVWNQLTMTTGLDDKAGNADCTDPACLVCLAIPGTRWAYHNAPYTLLESVIAEASGMTINQYFNSRIGSKIGATGLYIPIDYNRVFFSRARDMARFGLLIQGKGSWNGTPVLSDTAYYNAMIQTSQPHNLSYGYLWWLNGKGEHMLPGFQFKFNDDLVPTAPDDLFAALGKNDQKIYIVPSEGLVVIRMGETAGGVVPALSGFDSQVWAQIMDLECTSAAENQLPENTWTIAPNPATTAWNLSGTHPIARWELSNSLGQVVLEGKEVQVEGNGLPAGNYVLTIWDADNRKAIKHLLKAVQGD
jgi:CubicO group peptidase (beta-lactamase class C family)